MTFLYWGHLHDHSGGVTRSKSRILGGSNIAASANLGGIRDSRMRHGDGVGRIVVCSVVRNSFNSVFESRSPQRRINPPIYGITPFVAMYAPVVDGYTFEGQRVVADHRFNQIVRSLS